MATTNQERAKKLAERIKAQVTRSAGKGLDAGIRFLAARTRETLNVPAPRVAVRGPAEPGHKKGPIRYYRAKAKAESDAPPRKLSGNMQQKVTSELSQDGLTGVVGTKAYSEKGFNYPRYHERKGGGQKGSGKHPWLAPTFKKWKAALVSIIGRTFVFAMAARGNV